MRIRRLNERLKTLGSPIRFRRERARKAYYSALERNNKDIEITDWLVYFADTINQAQGNTIKGWIFISRKPSFTSSCAAS